MNNGHVCPKVQNIVRVLLPTVAKGAEGTVILGCLISGPIRLNNFSLRINLIACFGVGSQVFGLYVYCHGGSLYRTYGFYLTLLRYVCILSQAHMIWFTS